MNIEETRDIKIDARQHINADTFTMSEILVRYQETDQMGVAHHSVYPVWFEVGRTQFIKEHGISYGRLEADGLYMPLIGLTCEYRGFARYEDVLYIKTYMRDVTRSRVTFAYEVYKKSSDCLPAGKPITLGVTTHVFANKSLAPVNVSRYKPELYALFLTLCKVNRH